MESTQSSDANDQQPQTAVPVARLFLVDVLRDRNSRLILLWATLVLLLGTLVYHWLEGWSYLDSLYFCVISLTTVGYGDLTPDTAAAKVFTILYVLNGITILLALFDRINTVRRGRPAESHTA